MSISDEAVEAAAEWLPHSDDCEVRPERDCTCWQLRADLMRAALEAAAPHMLADHLLTLAADVRARGDIGKDGGLESWDYLTWQAERVRPTP